MNFYVVLLAALCSVLFSYVMMTSMKQKPPESWNDRPYSKSKFALYLNNKRKKSKLLGPLRVDCFRYVGFIVSIIVFLFSLAATIVDLLLNNAIQKSFGELTIVLITIIVLLLPIFYEVFLISWWTILDRNSPNNKQLKQLKQITKKKKK